MSEFEDILEEIEKFKTKLSNNVNIYYDCIEKDINKILKKYYPHKLVPDEPLNIKIYHSKMIKCLFINIPMYHLYDKYKTGKDMIEEGSYYANDNEELRSVLKNYNVKEEDIDYIISLNVFETYNELRSALNFNISND